MKTRAVNSNDFFTGEDERPKLRMGETACGLEVGDQVTTASGAFQIVGKGYGFWHLAPAGSANAATRNPVFDTPTTIDNFEYRSQFYSPADRIAKARELGIIS
jgi:hypothetical protein